MLHPLLCTLTQMGRKVTSESVQRQQDGRYEEEETEDNEQ